MAGQEEHAQWYFDSYFIVLLKYSSRYSVDAFLYHLGVHYKPYHANTQSIAIHIKIVLFQII